MVTQFFLIASLGKGCAQLEYVLFHVKEQNVIDVLRLLHDSMNLVRHQAPCVAQPGSADSVRQRFAATRPVAAL